MRALLIALALLVAAAQKAPAQATPHVGPPVADRPERRDSRLPPPVADVRTRAERVGDGERPQGVRHYSPGRGRAAEPIRPPIPRP